MTENRVHDPLVIDLNKLPVERGTCGYRKRIITESESNLVGISFLEINEARRHYHQSTTEIYYVLKGTGELEVDGKIISLYSGITVLIPPGASHCPKAEQDLEVLIIMIPPYGESQDQYYV